ncbi:MAG: hypothetical protein KAS17_07105 [Victivallaceae bacterium]|nr:hypothetical protein [Victivallaceae bacterium]
MDKKKTRGYTAGKVGETIWIASKDYTALTKKEIIENGALFQDEKPQQSKPIQTPIVIEEITEKDILDFIEKAHCRTIILLKENLPLCLQQEDIWKLVLEERYNHFDKVYVNGHKEAFVLWKLLSESLSNYERNNDKATCDSHNVITSSLLFIDSCFSRKKQIEYIRDNNTPISFNTLLTFMKFAQSFEQLFKLATGDMIAEKVSSLNNLKKQKEGKKDIYEAIKQIIENEDCANTKAFEIYYEKHKDEYENTYKGSRRGKYKDKCKRNALESIKQVFYKKQKKVIKK